MTRQMHFTRREVIRTAASGTLYGVISAAGVGGLALPSRSWAMDFEVLNSDQARTLVALAQTIAPHDQLDAAAYVLVIKRVDSDLSKDKALQKIYIESIAKLNTDGPFDSRSEAQRIDLASSMENTPFFQTMRVSTLQTLYDNPLAFSHFGYEGEVFSKGGYLHHGFNDLRWLPDPPASAAGPVPA